MQLVHSAEQPLALPPDVEANVEMTPGRSSRTDDIKREVSIGLDRTTLEGTLDLPKNANGVVLFAHGSRSSRHSPRNRYVAHVINSSQMGTLLFDLLTREEELRDRYTGELRFDIPFLARRLIDATNWSMSNPETRG
jgi:hypothetical protein